MPTSAVIDKRATPVLPYPVLNMQGVLSNPNIALEAAKRGTLERVGSGIAAGESAAVALFLPDLAGPSQFMDLAQHLRTRGHSNSRIEKILDGNFLRLLREVW